MMSIQERLSGDFSEEIERDFEKHFKIKINDIKT